MLAEKPTNTATNIEAAETVNTTIYDDEELTLEDVMDEIDCLLQDFYKLHIYT